MTCLEAQSNIMNFVEGKLPDDKVTDFVRHIRYCPNCADELEIYYTLIVGIRQVDQGEELSRDFKKEMNNELSRIEHKVKNAKRFRVSTFGIFFATAVVFLFLLYGRVLNKVNSIEQRIIKQEQGNYYFYEEFSPYLSICKEDFANLEAYFNDSVEEETDTLDVSFYEMIREYNKEHRLSN